MKVIVIMGVSGSGKTTVGRLLAEKLRIPFFDADNFHPEENINKMSSGIPLGDVDRHPWLEKLSSEIQEWNKQGGAVLACSALKEKYRQQLASKSSRQLVWIYLKAEFDTIKQRLEQRENHFFNPQLLKSQFADLEEPEYGLSVSIDRSPGATVDEILKSLGDTVN